MRVREYIQESRIDIGKSGTKTFDLDYTDPITQLDLYFEATNGGTDNIAAPFERCISKIEIVDGGEVLWDLPGDVAWAAYCHDAEQVPYCEREEAGGASLRQSIPIRFGLKLFDPVYAFDPRKHKNPQLKFTFDEATVRAAGADGYSTDSWTFTLHVRLMEDAPAPKGFLSYRAVETYTQSGAGDRRVELPTDRVIRYLICRAYDAGVAVYTSISNHRLSADGGKWVPFDLPARDFMNRMCDTFPPITLNQDLSLSNGVVAETWMGINLMGQITAKPNQIIATGPFYIYGQLYPHIYTDAGVAATDQDCYVSTKGWAIHNTLIYPFGDRMNPADWLAPQAFRKLDYFLTNGSGDGEVDICLQQVYPY